jgi:hypothetical protein
MAILDDEPRSAMVALDARACFARPASLKERSTDARIVEIFRGLTGACARRKNWIADDATAMSTRSRARAGQARAHGGRSCAGFNR